MSSKHDRGQPATLFGELLRQRRQTAEEFSEAAEQFAREHGLDATLSARHVQRFASGTRADGRPLGPVRQSTRRLLEQMLGAPIEQLLQPVREGPTVTSTSDEALELRARLAVGRSVDAQTVSLLRHRLDITRVIDRRLGASALLGELRSQISQVERLLGDSLNPDVRASLAEVLVDASTLAGWQSLDQGLLHDAWNHYDRARAAAREARSRSLEAYACAGQAVVLLDIGETASAVALTSYASGLTQGRTPGLLRAWLSAGHGEALAAHGEHLRSMVAFDAASRTMSTNHDKSEVRFLVFDSTHLARWRGSSLARLGDKEAIRVLSEVLHELDPTFTRAEAALRVDLAQVLSTFKEDEAAAAHAQRARLLSAQIGSVRQRRRLQTVTT